MWALYKLQAKGWFANIFNKMDFIMTLLFLAVLGSMVAFGLENELANNYGITGGFDINNSDIASAYSQANLAIIASISLLMVASSAINTFGISFFEMKESVLMKRIGATNITKLGAVTSFILWGMTSMVFIIGWMAIIIGFCQIPGIAEATGGVLYVSGDIWSQVNWVGVFAAIIITMVSFYAIAFFFVSISKNSMAYQMTATFYFFLISFLGGAYTPNADRMWMDIVSFMSPLGWGTDLMTYSLQGGDVFNWANGFDLMNPMTGMKEHIDGLKLAGTICMPVIFGSLAAGFSAKFFKWD